MMRRLVLACLVLLALLGWATVARAEPLRVLVAVGHRAGLRGEAPLKHAVRDAERVRDLFVRLGGVRPEHALLLREPTGAALGAALDRAAQIARAGRRDEVALLFYFSGHGDRERLHLGPERVALRDIDAKLAAAPAALRIVIADACRTGDVRPKGFAAEEPFAISLSSGGASGVVRIHASADGEVAQESDDLGGAVFTHYWLAGLAGAADADGDARVTLSEAYAFAYHQTLFRSARASGVVQRPEAVFDVKEAAPIVLTQTARASAIRVPRASDAHYVVYALGSRTVAAELWSAPDRAVTLAVPPGRYVVHRRAGGRSAAVEIALGKGEQRELGPSEFRAVAGETLAQKGGDIVLAPDELGAFYAARRGRLVDLGHEAGFRYAHAWDGAWALGVGAFVGVGDRDTALQTSDLTWFGAEATLERRARVGDVLLRAGLGPRVLGLVQTLRRADAERVARAGYDAERRFRAAAVGGHALLGARWLVSPRAWLGLEGTGELLGAELEGSAALLWSAGAGASVGLSF